jgi:hypothetical protein
MKDSQVYLRAAEYVFKGRGWDMYSCLAVDRAAGDFDSPTHTPQAKRYAKTFANSSSDLQDKFNKCDDPKSVRVLALLFMHQIALDEEAK